MQASHTTQLLDLLFEMASNIQIEPNFCIRHPQYQPFALPAKVADRFLQASAGLQHKYLTLLLRNFLYGIYYNGSLKKILANNAYNAENLSNQYLENHAAFGIDWQFYEQLHTHNHGKGYLDSGWRVLRREPDGSVAVTKGGLVLYVERDSDIESTLQSLKIGELIAIWMPKNRLNNGFYVAVSNFGQNLSSNPNADIGEGRVYFNFTPTGAIAVMESLTLQLNAAAIPFCFQVLHNPSAFGRYDSGVLCFEHENYPTIRKVLQDIHTEHQSHFMKEVPLFTKFLAPGLSLAEEPTQKFAVQESFGMNRCQIIANALLEAWQKGKNSTEERIRAIRQHFARLGIDLNRPYLNPSSEDIYYPLG